MARDRASTVSADGRSALVSFKLAGDDEQTAEIVQEPLAAVAAARSANPDVRVEQYGDASLTRALDAADEDSQRRSELFSYPATLVILLIAFGALVAAGVPLLLGMTAVAGSLGCSGR